MKLATVPIEAGSPLLIAGPTNSGKTFWIHKLLRQHRQMFTQEVKSVLYCYGVYQQLYNEMKSGLDVPITFKQGIPSKDEVDALHDGDFHLLILDDLMEKIVKSQDMQELFSKYCHHLNISAIFVSQNVFQPGRYTRTISLNCHIIVLFANKRDESQINVIGRQFYPVHWKKFVQVYRHATKAAFGYLLIDCTPAHPREIQLRTNVFPPETCYTYALE